MDCVSSWPSSLRRKRNGSFRSTPTMKLKRLWMMEVLPESGAPINKIVLCSSIRSIWKGRAFSLTAMASKTQRLKVAVSILVLDLVNGTAYRPVSFTLPILLLFSINIVANRMSLTTKLGLELPLLCIICPSTDSRSGNESPVDSCSTTSEFSVLRLLHWGECEFAAICWETGKVKSINIWRKFDLLGAWS